MYKQLANCPTAGVADGLTSSPASLELKRIPSRTAQANYVQVYVHLCCIWVCVPPPSPPSSPLPIIIIIGPALLDPARNGSSYASLCVCAFKWCRCSKCSSCCCDVAAYSVPPPLAFSVSTTPLRPPPCTLLVLTLACLLTELRFPGTWFFLLCRERERGNGERERWRKGVRVLSYL